MIQWKLGCLSQKQKWKNQPITRPGVEYFHWFILPLLLVTETMQFLLDRKQRNHKQNQCSASDSVSLIFSRSYSSTDLITTPTTILLLVKTRFKITQLQYTLVFIHTFRNAAELLQPSVSQPFSIKINFFSFKLQSPYLEQPRVFCWKDLTVLVQIPHPTQGRFKSPIPRKVETNSLLSGHRWQSNSHGFPEGDVEALNWGLQDQTFLSRKHMAHNFHEYNYNGD